MGWLIAKYLLTAAVVVLVSEVAKRSDRLGGNRAKRPGGAGERVAHRHADSPGAEIEAEQDGIGRQALGHAQA